MAREFNSLARDRGAAIASKLAPTLVLWRTQNGRSAKIPVGASSLPHWFCGVRKMAIRKDPCGSELARDAFGFWSVQQPHAPLRSLHRTIAHGPAQHWRAAFDAGADQLALQRVLMHAEHIARPIRQQVDAACIIIAPNGLAMRLGAGASSSKRNTSRLRASHNNCGRIRCR